ncbi:hypothetical protein EG68_08167 [Paragonimus skrjabini miyazakii]|uniref:ARID domain-containing protein n=1 Tax=Paragonimus skrjabini miyazakii TaxID=59628 RepID=A0A8S9YP53_9TREM|nr:hypothetical protein EG68_08167 [Paragonimus skrjabini miyazakii]
MNKTKRIASCPNLLSRPSRNRDKDLNNPALLRKIQKQYDHHIPRILGHPIKLPALFTAVVVRGGYRAVCDRRLWSKVASDLHLPEACANCSIGLRRIYHHYLIKHELKEYPDLSEHYLTQTYAEFSTSETAASEFSFSSATAVERNLGIAPPDGTNTAFSSFSGYHSLADLSCVLNQNTHRSSSLHPQDFSWRAGITEKSLTDQSDHLDSLGRTNSVDGSNWDDPTRLRDLTELTLVELALASGLPNEIDAALNALLALSINPCITTGASTSIRLAHCKNLLNLLLATVGIYDDSVGSFIICDPVWRQQTQTNFLKFWHNTVKDPCCRFFLRPDVFINPDLASDLTTDVPSSTLTELFAPSVSSDFHSSHSFLSRAEVEDDLETTRVLLVATILVNLVSPPPTLSAAGHRVVEDDQDESDYDVFVARCRSPHTTTPLATWRENARYLAASPTALRFAFLCAYAAHSDVRQLGLQLLPSLRYPLDPPRAFATSVRCPLEWTPLLEFGGSRLSELTLTFLVRCLLESPDRASLIGGLNFLANLATVPEKGNEESLLNGLPSVIWPRLAQLICLPDLAVVCATLEALRCLTNLGQYACTFAWQACLDWSSNATSSAVPLILVQPLLALLTLEGQAMGSQSLHRIKLMQRTPQAVPPPLSPHSYPPRPLPSSRVASNSTEWATANHIPPPYHCRSVALSSPVVQPKMQRQPTEFTNRHHNFSPFMRPSMVPRPSIVPQLPMGVVPPPDFVPTPARALPSSYRPPSGSTSCTGLINLLASSTSSTVSLPTPSSGSHSVGGNLSLGSSSLSNVVPPVIGKPAITTAPNTPTLSELTDRLQMPPPSLPPPSALRRSAKSSLSRTISSSPSSPLPPCKLPTTVPTTSCPTVIPSVTHSSKTSTMPSDERPETKVLSVANTKELPGSDCTVFRCETTSYSTEPLVNSNGSVPVEEPAKNIRAFLKLQDGQQPLVNGESKMSVAHDGDDTLTETTVDKCRSAIKYNTGLQSHNSYANGLKPGILQAAMEALHDAKLEKLGLPMEKKSDVLLNGLPECTKSSMLEATLKSPYKSTGFCVKSDIDAVSKGLKQSNPAAAMNGYAENREVEQLIADDRPVLVQTDKCDCRLTSNIVNGTVVMKESSDVNSSDTSTVTCELDSSTESVRHSSAACQRYLKRRRRRWGSRSHMFTPKRRREHVYMTAKSLTTELTSSPVGQITSPLKPLPLQPEPLPDSVLGPTWKPPWSPTEFHCTIGSPSVASCDVQAVDSPPRFASFDNPTFSKPSIDKHSNHSSTVPVSVFASNSDCTKNTVERHPPKYLCEWETCCSSFDARHEVSEHVYLFHLRHRDQATASRPPVRRCCRWRGCSSASLARAPFALMTHVLDVHCSPVELERSRKQAGSQNGGEPHIGGRRHPASVASISSITSLHHLCSTVPHEDDRGSSSSTLGDQTAWSIVRSVEIRQMQLDMWAAQHHCRHPFSATLTHPPHLLPPPPPREGPVTKHLRVTAALVLRNLLTYLEEARIWLSAELPLLSELVMGCSPCEHGLRTNDASSVIAQCLALSVRPVSLRSNTVRSYYPPRPLLPCESVSRAPTISSSSRASFAPSTSSRRSVHHHPTWPPIYNVDLDAKPL